MGCIRKAGFCRRRNKMRKQPRTFGSASLPLTQSDSIFFPSVAIFAPSFLPSLHCMLVQDWQILFCEMQCLPDVPTTSLQHIKSALFTFLALQGHKEHKTSLLAILLYFVLFSSLNQPPTLLLFLKGKLSYSFCRNKKVY